MSNTDPDRSLKDRLADAQQKRRESEGPSEKTVERYKSLSGAGQAMTFASELVAPILVGLGLGILIDWWAKTSPLFLLLMFCFGLVAGVLGVIRAYRSFNARLAEEMTQKSGATTNGNESQ